MDDGNPLWRLGIIVLLIAVEAMISGAKKALETGNESNIKKQNETNDKKTKQVLLLFEKKERYIDMAQFLIGSIHILIGVIFFKPLLTFAKQFVDAMQITGNQRMITTLFITLLMICFLLLAYLFGSVLPSKLSFMHPEVTLKKYSGILFVFYRIFTPFTTILSGIASLIFRLMQINPKDLEENVTEDEIISIVNEGFEQGILEDNEAEMISNIMELDNKEVRDVMTNRKKVVSISNELSLFEALKFMTEERYSRFPLYENERDNIIGVLHFKDVTKRYIAGEDGIVSLKQIARDPYFVPVTQNVDSLFDDMQLKKIHMAIAVDEYGQMAGVIALEDILEEIVGNILDEYDVDERMILKQSNSRFIMRGLTPLDEVEKELKIHMKFEAYEVDTLNGFLLSQIGHLPADEEKPVVYYAGYRFHVLDAKNNMIRTVRVVRESESMLAV